MAAEDVGSTLSTLERKLKDLERELQGVGREPLGPPASVGSAEALGAPAPPPPPPTHPAPEPLASAPAPAPAPAPLAPLQGQLEELARFRSQLERSAQELMGEYERLLARLTGDLDHAAASNGTAAAPPAPAVPGPTPTLSPPPPHGPPAAPFTVEDPGPASLDAGVPPISEEPAAPQLAAALPAPPAPDDPATLPPSASVAAALPPELSASQPPAPWQPGPDAGLPPSYGADLDQTVLEGAITLDAGPFEDIATLSGFEQSLGAMDGVEDVYVRGFEGDRALIDVTLTEPAPFGAALRAVSTVPFTLLQAAPGRVSVAIGREG